MSDALYSIQESTLTDIADAIRSKKGTSAPIAVTDLADTIASIDGSSPIELRMTFKNNTPSNAYGEIVLSAKEAEYSGNYDIMWGDANGAMSDYSKIDTLTLDVANNKTMASIELMEYNAIPSDATRLVAIKNNTIVASFSIPSSKLSSDTFDYVFNGFSDAHRQYETAEQDIAKMLTISKNDADVVGSFGSGDLTANGTESECAEWLATVEANRGTKPVYTSNGNHEAKNTSAICYTNPNGLRKYLDTDWEDETEPYFYKEVEGDIFVFMPIFINASNWNSSNTLFPSNALDWLEELLETYRNQRVFLFAHVPPKWDVNGIKIGGIYSGFATGNGAYYHDAWGDNKTDRNKFLALLDHYKNVIWFSGHSHIKYEYQKMWESLNVLQYKGGARFVHLSSLSVPRDIMDGSITDQIYAEAEFTRVEVYDDYIRLRSYNLATDKYYGLCEYIIDTTPVTIPPKTKTVVSISATKTKTSYYTDETLSTSDITVTATYSDSSTADVSSSAVFDTSNVDISTTGTYTIGISYTYGEDTVNTNLQVSSTTRPSVKTLASISASKTTTAYAVNETLSTADITVTATYSDTTTADVTASAQYDTSNVDMTTAGAYTIGVSYTEDGVTATTTVGVTVSSVVNPTIILDVTYNGTCQQAGDELTPSINDGKGSTQVRQDITWATSEQHSAYMNKTLYYRLVSNTGVSESDKIGIFCGIGNNKYSTGGGQNTYGLTETAWTPLVDDNNVPMVLTSTYGYFNARCRSSSSSTATFPVSVNCRLQVGYVDN